MTAPVMVSERLSVTGSRSFARLVAAGDLAGIAAFARAEVAAGAAMLDLCLAGVAGDEAAAAARILPAVLATGVPIALDSADAKVLAALAGSLPAGSLLNSVNLAGPGDDGPLRDALTGNTLGLVLSCVDADGPAATADRKLAVALRLFERWTRLGVEPGRLVVDPLALPVARPGAARATLEALVAIKERLPGVRTLLGISDVSFGFIASLRPLIDTTYLHHAAAAGLDLAIANPHGLPAFAELPLESRARAEALLFDPLCEPTVH